MTPTAWDIEAVRADFPALALHDQGRPRIYLDAPGGSHNLMAELTWARDEALKRIRSRQ